MESVDVGEVIRVWIEKNGHAVALNEANLVVATKGINIVHKPIAGASDHKRVDARQRRICVLEYVLHEEAG